MPPSPRLQRRVVDIDDVAGFDVAAQACESMDGWRIRHVDLTERTAELVRMSPAGALLLGCRLEPAALGHLQTGGALVYPEAPDAPVDEYRNALYTSTELYAGLEAQGYAATPDATIYGWSQHRSAERGDLLVRTLHDASIETALDDLLADGRRPVVGVMGGHALQRGDPSFRVAAELGRRLERSGLLVATGGGPGAMEAANLGAYLADEAESALDDAVAILGAVPTFRPSVWAWASAAGAVRRRWPSARTSLGVPTWFYGHEPPNAFASHHAKFFQNSVREATLLNRCTGGIVFLPGAAGTVQEVFQDACENYYADATNVAPMVLVGIRHWTETVPAWPLLCALASQGGFSHAVFLVDDVVEAGAVMESSARARRA